ncbi:MAG: peptidase U32 [Candidatus Muiribacterium halophilum]|uniref:Peptidase U32 n=1 Tax=Muiribacterium halophilum TaxID=2053465 RepID=A0A2N5ZBG2_MUIH1|nr:MAG: peptidase U32 [Candidatus Muirbacterium halophilum]
MYTRPELLAPAGDFEKLRFAIGYGADAVYLGLKSFSLRKNSRNFTSEQLKKAVEYAHERDAKVYLALNSYLKDSDLEGVEEIFNTAKECGVDALIVSDPGVISMNRELGYNIPIHISTQANTTNSYAVRFWQEQGAERVILAREVGINNIKSILEHCPQMEVEMFVHGAMCVSYSGRCLMSSYMTGRDSNQGDCAQPCRWKYRPVFLEEDRRKGEIFPVYEDETGTFLFNSKDLNLSRRIPDLIKAGVHSLKIEGRMKSSYYVAMVIRVYRQIIDSFMEEPENFEYKQEWDDELKKISYREYTEAAYENEFSHKDQVYTSNSYIRTHKVIGFVDEPKGYDPKTHSFPGVSDRLYRVKIKNEVHYGQQIEVVCKQGSFTEILHDFYSENKEGELERVMRGKNNDHLYIPFNRDVNNLCIIRTRDSRHGY